MSNKLLEKNTQAVRHAPDIDRVATNTLLHQHANLGLRCQAAQDAEKVTERMCVTGHTSCILWCIGTLPQAALMSAPVLPCWLCTATIAASINSVHGSPCAFSLITAITTIFSWQKKVVVQEQNLLSQNRLGKISMLPTWPLAFCLCLSLGSFGLL